jgi:hypothetical protein
MKPMAAALAGALISGIGMYAVGTHAQQPGMSYYPTGTQPAMGYYTTAPQQFAAPAVVPVAQRTVATPRRTVYRAAQPAAAPVYRNAEVTPQRSKTKTVLVIGGSAASGAGLGGLLGGKKGALVGAALGGGAASIYEATRR